MSHAIGIDIGGTNIKYGIADAGGCIVYEGLKDTGRPDVLENLKKIIAECRQEALSRGVVIEGIGIGVPAILDGEVVTGCGENLPEIEGMLLGPLLHQYVQLPVVLENDANLMGLAEQRFGAARGMIDVVFLTVGTGVGGALVLNGRLYGGHGNRGAELGHIRVDHPGRPCGCGASGCLEAHASVKALISDYEEAGGKRGADGRHVFSRYMAGDGAAVMAMDRHFEYLGSGIASLINIFSPQKVVIGGGITEAGEDYIRPIRRQALSQAMKETAGHTLIEGALLGNKAGFLGAVARVFDGGC
jgi:glucokinase